MNYIEHDGTLELKPNINSSFMYVVSCAIALAKIHHKKVYFEFENQVIQVNENDRPTDLYSKFMKASNSPCKNTVSSSIRQILNK